jgi:hypothetical protein
VRHQVGDCVQACLERLRITQGAVQPAPQQAAAHRRAAAVEDGKQRVRLAAGQVAVDLQIAPRRRIQHHAVLAALHGQGRNVRQVPALRVAHIAEQAAGGADCQGQVLAAEAAQVVGLELLAKAALRRLEVELPGRLGARPGTRRHGRVRELLVVEHLRGVEALELAQEGFLALHLADPEATAAEVQPGHAEALPLGEQRQEQPLASLFE